MREEEIKMLIKEVLNEFAKFAEYDPNQKSFQLNSANFEFHQAGKDIEQLLSGFDPSGVLSVMRARDALITAATNIKIQLYGWLTDPKINAEMCQFKEMWDKLNDPEVLEQEEAYLNSINETITKSMGIRMIGERDMEKERQQFLKSTMRVVEDLRKMKLDVYQNSNSPVGTVEKFSVRILVFERMADCILHISQGLDAMYLCYISQQQSADGYFAFVLKSNGNLVAFHDRIDEKYIGQHVNSRNGRWTDAHMDSLFPYNYIFSYENYDYKGYAEKYIIDDERLDFVNLNVEVYQPLLIAMLILKNKYEGKTFSGEPLLLNTFMKENFLEEHRTAATTELSVVEKNEVAVRSRQYVCNLDPERIVTDAGYNKEFGLYEHSTPWVGLYGAGFAPDFSKALASFYGNRHYAEFIGNTQRMDIQVYYEIREQLAEYIKARMKEELDRFGKDEAREYWTNKAKGKKDRFIDLICKKMYMIAHPEADWGKDTPCLEMVKKEDSGSSRAECVYNQKLGYNYKWGQKNDILDDYNGAKCTTFYWLNPNDWKTMEAFLEEPLPKVFCGLGEDEYNGNSLLNVVDPVGELKCPLEEYFRGYSLCIGFSKTGWKQTYYSWLKKNGYEDEIDRLKDERKDALKNKKEEEMAAALIPIKPYEPGDNFDNYKNKDELIIVERTLNQIFPGTRILSFDTRMEEPDDKKLTARQVYITVPIKGNKEKIQQLCAVGWKKYYRSVKNGRKLLRMYYYCKGKTAKKESDG